MTTRKHVHEERFTVSAERLFGFLITPSAVRSWWGAARVIVIPQRDGIWAAAWGDDEDDPDYLTAARICDYDPPRRMLLTNYIYYAKTGGLPFEAEFSTEFVVEPCEAHALLRVTQDGFPNEASADEYYAACIQGWKDTFAGMQRFAADKA